MIFFLERYINSSGKDRDFFEECFAYAVYDFINDQETGLRYSYDLEGIAREATLINSQEKEITKKTLKKILKNNDIEFVNEIRRYFFVFYKSGRKTG